MLFKITLCLFCFLLFAGGALSVLGQDVPQAAATPTPDLELLKAQRELVLEKARADIAEQKKRTLAARLPDSKDDTANKTLTGEIKVEDKSGTFEIESIALSYESLSIIAKQVSEKLQNGASEFNQIVIYSEPDFKNLVLYRIFESQAVPALDAYDLLLTADPTKRGNPRGLSRGIGSDILQYPLIGTSFVKSAIDFISLFRTDTTISNKKVTIEETALGALVARQMKSERPNMRIYFPKAYIPDNDWEPADEKAVLTQLTKLYSYQEVVKGILADYDKTAAAEKDKHVYHQQIPALTALNEQVGKLLANYENSKGETQGNCLRDLVRAETLNQMLTSDPKTGILQLKVLEAGGSERITRNLIFGSKIRHSGSAIVEYLLFDMNGVLRSSEVLYHHTGFQKMENARNPGD